MDVLLNTKYKILNTTPLKPSGLVNNLLYVIAKYFGIQDPADFCDSIQQPVCRPGDDPFIHDIDLVVMNGFDYLVAGLIFNE